MSCNLSTTKLVRQASPRNSSRSQHQRFRWDHNNGRDHTNRLDWNSRLDHIKENYAKPNRKHYANYWSNRGRKVYRYVAGNLQRVNLEGRFRKNLVSGS